jgi:superfamily II DNA or RNA helicase
MERIESFLGIPKKDIGRIGQGKSRKGKQITVAMIQSMEKAFESTESIELLNAFGTVIIDECHHVPAETYQGIIGKLNSYYMYGLTATPFRKYNDGKLIFIHLGEIIHEAKAPDVQNQANHKLL